MRDSRAPCPPTESMRAAQLMVGTAYESPCRGETLCFRLCPPYDSRAWRALAERNQRMHAAMSFQHDPPLHPGAQRADALDVIHHPARDRRRVRFGEHIRRIGERCVAVAAARQEVVGCDTIDALIHKRRIA